MKTTVNQRNHLLVTTMLIISSLLLVSQLYAQSPESRKTPEERAKSLTDKMKEELVLTDAQYQPIYDLNLKYAKQNDEIAGSSEGKRAKIKQIRSAQSNKEEELKAILTEEQYQKYGAMKDELKSKAKEAYKKGKE